ncbi:MAG: tRNA (adenosine(37)-N6)-threonylcarbamoyltransferase complex ATPase subunit type 1 TsaE [Clostridia bacterium]|nr:tRNA (adenosine(37)-N6)-threonylcarbamoyltransferase complex ATPase subunit type 1 TsaE [Clostridia bacterium]
MREYISAGADDTQRIAAEIAGTISPGAVLCLRGEMGAGKTVFTTGLCRALGVSDYVTSPTFTVVNEYDGDAFRVYHFDMYRIEEEDELLEIGFEEYVSAGGVCVIEWPQNVEGALPKHRTEITIEKCGENERKITVQDI